MERLTFSDAGPADWPYLLCLWWRNVRATHGFVAEDYLRAIGAALPGVYLPAMERVRLAWLEVAPAEGDGSDHAPEAGEDHFPTGTVAVPRPSQGRLPAGFLGSVEQRVEMLFVEPGLRGRGIGTALLEDFGSRHPEILLDVNEQNTAARIFYARRGFEAFPAGRGGAAVSAPASAPPAGRGRRDRANSLTHGLPTASHPCRHNRGRHPVFAPQRIQRRRGRPKNRNAGGDPAFWHRPGE
jgi:putative acetyltransferase